MKKLSLLHIQDTPNSHGNDLVKSAHFQNIIKHHHINWKTFGSRRLARIK